MADKQDASQMYGSVPTKFVRTSDYKEIYANNVRFSLTPGDFFVRFGCVMQNDEDLTSRVEESVGMRFSPQTMKVFVMNLAAALELWESQFGEINISGAMKPPEEVMAALRRRATTPQTSRE